MKAKNQRFVLAALAISAVIAAGLLFVWGASDKVAFFYAPSDVKKNGLPLGRGVRIGGMIQKGTLKSRDVTYSFVVTDGAATIPVTFTGMKPSLVIEGSGVVADGEFRPDGSFVAKELLAKHDEKYMPPQLAGKMHETKSLKE